MERTAVADKTRLETGVATPALHHVNLKTGRLREMIEWYGLIVGLHPNHEFDGGAWLTNDNANHRLALLSTPEVRDDPDKLFHAGIHHTAFEYASLEELLGTYIRLRDLSILPHSVLDHGMTLSFYYLDPDENSVELQVDHFGDWAKSTDFMHGEMFARDPIGTYVDPDRLIAAWQKGLSAEELHSRAYRGEYAPAEPQDLRIPSTDQPRESE
jgi:catechol 2,3-dioxygenase